MGTHPQAHAVICPFCKGTIPDSLTRFGGNCPHCMLEIPGEEAPTDPGLAARMKAQEEGLKAAAQRRKRNRILGVVGLFVVVGLGAGGYVQWQKQQEGLTYELDDYYEMPLSDLQAAPEQAPEQVTAPTPGRTTAPRKRPGLEGIDGPIVTGTTAPEGAPTDTTGLPKRASGGTGDAVVSDDVTRALGGTDGAPSLGVGGITINRPEIDQRLSDPNAIKDMARRVIDSFSPQLQSCYNQRLKSVPGLAGAWKVSFVIEKDGATRDVKVAGVNAGDDELESCMARSVQGWRFQKINRDQPISKTYRFGASSW